jgi:thioredoxin-related protein
MERDDEEAPPAWIKKLAFGLFVLFVGISFALASIPTKPETEGPAVAAPVSDRPSLLVYESASCGWCLYFRKSIAPDYERSHLEALAPLRYVNVSELRRGSAGYRLSGRITATPTFVLVDRHGREIERLRGLPGSRDIFMQEAERMLNRMPAESVSN